MTIKFLNNTVKKEAVIKWYVHSKEETLSQCTVSFYVQSSP